MRLTPILTRADLAAASESEVEAVMKALTIRKWIKEWMETRSRRRPSRKEYHRLVAEQTSMDCPKCDGWGEVLTPLPRKQGVIHPSSANKCTLALYYDVTGEKNREPKKNTMAELLTFGIGHSLHVQLQDGLQGATEDPTYAPLKSARFEAEARVSMESGLIQGNTDGVLEFPWVRAGIEIKSAGESMWNNVRLTPPKDHRIQAGGLYSTGLDLPFMVYLYVYKLHPHPIKELVVPYDPSVYKGWWRLKGKQVKEAVEDEQAPVADATPGECRQCPYNKNCPQSLAERGLRAFQRKA